MFKIARPLSSIFQSEFITKHTLFNSFYKNKIYLYSDYNIKSKINIYSRSMQSTNNETKNKKTDNNEKTGAQYNVLPNAEVGKVVTRFPPEPSGYLHIGHVKAAMLNYHYAKMYEGKMILRFDDTNPLNEKEEYEQSIKDDLNRLEIFPDKVSHTSDYFDVLIEYMTRAIKEGKCYCDNTDVDSMRKERTEGIASKCREQTVEENLKIWEEMLGADPSPEIKKYCVRGKLDYLCANKCLRDPVFYRFTDVPHHKLGTKYKLYPTYDFACPIVDSIEGVTHCLRANEYSDRIPMYKWVLTAFDLKDINIYEFSRMNLVHTVLSKRNLRWFVNNKIVDNWIDPRFPTVQGVLRRGIKVQTLRDFMLAQGPSKNTNLMEWDKIYAMNRDIIDPTARRLFAVSIENGVTVHVENLSNDVEEVTVDWYQKNKELGTRKQYRSKSLLIENDDAKELQEGQKLTLKNWGNSLVTKIHKENDKVVAVWIKLTPEDTVFKNTKVVHWVPLGDNLSAKVILYEYGHLISVRAMKDESIESVANKESKFETPAVAEAAINEVKQGDIIQLERRGFFYVDQKQENGAIHLNYIPDGKTKTMSVISTKVDAKTLSKGEGESKKSKDKKKDKKEKENKKQQKEQAPAEENK